MLLSDKITTFIRKSQLVIAEISSQTAKDLDASFIGDEDVKLANELISAIECLQDPLLNWTEKDTEIFIDYYMSIASLNDIAIVELSNKETLIVVNDGEDNPYDSINESIDALQKEVIGNKAETDAEIARLDNRIDTLDFSNLVPQELIDEVDANSAARHTHTNLPVLEQVTQQNLTEISDNTFHRNDNSVHVTTAEKNSWNSRITQTEFTTGLNSKAEAIHTHEISDVNGLQEAFDGLTPEKGDPGDDGGTPIMQAGAIEDGEYSIDVDNTDPLNPVLNLVVPKGEDGTDLHIDEYKLAGDRLDSVYDSVADGYSILGTDNGILYFRKTADDIGESLPATSTAGWIGVPFTGRNGWSPNLGTFEVDPTKTVLYLIGWVGGEGDYPELGSGETLYVGQNGYTPEISQAVNIKGNPGPVGENGRVIFPDASGDLSGRDTYDAEDKDFMYYDTETGLIYIKRSDASGDWSDGYQWRGDQGVAGPEGPEGGIEGLDTSTTLTFLGGDNFSTINTTLSQIPDFLSGKTLYIVLTQGSQYVANESLELERFYGGHIVIKSSNTLKAEVYNNVVGSGEYAIKTYLKSTLSFENLNFTTATPGPTGILRCGYYYTTDTEPVNGIFRAHNCTFTSAKHAQVGNATSMFFIKGGNYLFSNCVFGKDDDQGHKYLFQSSEKYSPNIKLVDCSSGTNPVTNFNSSSSIRIFVNIFNSSNCVLNSNVINNAGCIITEYPIGGGSETKTPDNTEPYDGADGYLANSYVSYINALSPDPLFQINYLYLSRVDIAAGISPEDDLYDAATNPTGKWERIGESAEIVADTSSCYVSTITELKAIVNYKNGHDVIVKSKNAIYSFKEDSETGIKPNDGGAGSWVYARHISLTRLIRIYTSADDDAISYWETGKSVLVTKLNTPIDIEDPETGDVINFALNVSSSALVTRTGAGLLEADFTIDYLGGNVSDGYELFDITPVANQLELTFDANKMSNDYAISGPIEITKSAGAHKPGKIIQLIKTADGNALNKPIFSTDYSLRSDNWDNTNGIKNVITMKYLNTTSKIIIDYAKL